VVVDVYESGETVPYVEVPPGSSVDLTDRVRLGEAVAKAAAALTN
jgi:hypothetical protein